MLHQIYQCPKCQNVLLVSNKMLHDLRCTYENPATYENILKRQNQLFPNYQIFPQTVERPFSRKSIEQKMKPKEEFIELNYEPQGNKIQKKSDNLGYSVPISGLSDYSQYNSEDFKNNFSSNYDNNNNTYYEMKKEVEVKKPPSIIIKQTQPQEIIYHAPVKYDPHIIINKPIEETVINSKKEINFGVANEVIRTNMTLPAIRINHHSYLHKNMSVGVNYPKKNGRNENPFKQFNDMSNLENYDMNLSNQLTIQNHHKHYNPFQSQAQMSGKNNNISRNILTGLPKKKNDMGNMNYYSYEYHF